MLKIDYRLVKSSDKQNNSITILTFIDQSKETNIIY